MVENARQIQYIYYLVRRSELWDEKKVNCKKDAFRFCFLLFLPCFKSVFSVKHQFRTNRALQVSTRLEEGPQRVPQPELNLSQMGNTAVERAAWQTFKYLLNKLLYAHALIFPVQSSSWKLILKAANICIDSVVLSENESSQGEKKAFYAYNKINIFSVWEKLQRHPCTNTIRESLTYGPTMLIQKAWSKTHRNWMSFPKDFHRFWIRT